MHMRRAHVVAICLLLSFSNGKAQELFPGINLRLAYLSEGDAVLGVALAAPQQTPPPSPAEVAGFRAEIQKIEEAVPRIADRGAALSVLARRYAQLGELSKALALLKECVALDEGFDPGEFPTLQPLHSNPEFRELVDQARRDYPEVHRARVAFTIPEKDLFPEGLAVDPDKHLFYMGSMHHRKIITITKAGEVADFVKPNLYDLLPIGGIKVDADHSVWAASDNDHDSELLHFDAHGKLLDRYPPPGPGPHVLNDLVLHAAQEIFATDTLAHQVYRFDRRTRRFTPLTFHRPLFYPNGIALSNDQSRLYVADIMGVILVDLKKSTTREVNPGQHNTLAGIDGLYWYKGSLVGVQYGTGSHRVARWRLSSDGSRVTSAEILEHHTPLVNFPTTGAIDGGNFYFIGNTGIANLKDDKIVDLDKLEPVHIAVVALD
jgi:hypothetical protein